MPPQIMYSIQTTKEFKVNCYNRSKVVPTRHLGGKLAAKLETYNLLKSIIKTMDNLEPNLNAELKSCSKYLRELNLSSTDDTDDASCNRINQMEYVVVKQHGIQYNTNTMRDSIKLYIRSRNCYNAVRDLTILPHKDTVKLYCGKLGSPRSIEECSTVIGNVFSSLNGLEKHCKILVGVIHIKPGARYQGGHIIGYAEDASTKLAKIVLALMVAPLMGKPAFVARLIPVHSLTAELLYDQVSKVLQIIHEATGYVYMIMNDDLKANQRMFSKFPEIFTPKSIPSVCHPIPNEEHDELFLLFHPVHLLKNIRNNWWTEKMQKLTYIDPETNKTGIACWNDLLHIYNLECEGIVKSTGIHFFTLFPTNFEKQKASLALNIFNEKTVTALRQEKREETLRFIELVVCMWKMLNINLRKAGKRFTDPDRNPFNSLMIKDSIS